MVKYDEINELEKKIGNLCSGSVARVKNVVRNGATLSHMVLGVF
jgi:hypothetical protein